MTEAVRLLLRRTDVDGAADLGGRTALHHATQAGSPSIVKLLLERPDVDVSTTAHSFAKQIEIYPDIGSNLITTEN